MLYISLNVHYFTDQESNPVLIQSPHASPVHCTVQELRIFLRFSVLYFSVTCSGVVVCVTYGYS